MLTRSGSSSLRSVVCVITGCICKWTQSVTLLPYRLISRCDKRTLFILEEKLQWAATNEKACRHSDMFRVGFNWLWFCPTWQDGQFVRTSVDTREHLSVPWWWWKRLWDTEKTHPRGSDSAKLQECVWTSWACTKTEIILHSLALHSVKKMKVLHLELSLTVPSFSLLITLWSLEQCLVTCLSTGRTVVLFGPEEQIRVSKAAGDVWLEPGGGQHSHAG